MPVIRSFDAFPKVASTHTVRSTRGSYSTILTLFCILFMTWVELGQYFGGEVDHQFQVDNTLNQNLKINLDIVVAMPCNFIHTNVQDITDDRFLASELLTYEGFPFFIPPSYNLNDAKEIVTPDLDEIMQEGVVAEFRQREDHKDAGEPACHIYGSVPVNKVSGDFHITAKGYGYRDRSVRSHVDSKSLNFTHVISEFSFGEFYPYISNPLDATARSTQENFQKFEYHINVVPTIYKLLGVEINTNQYSVTNQDHLVGSRKKGVPGIFFRYDFEPISLIVEDRRIPFTTFVVRLATIYGGILIIAKWGFKTVEKLLIIFFGKRFASRGEEKTASLLDE